MQVEITEHELVDDRPTFMASLAALRRRGARIAVDDVGEGYAGLQQVMAVGPDVLKVDRALVTGVHHQPALAALREAIVRFAARTGAQVCAEGIEEAEELSVPTWTRPGPSSRRCSTRPPCSRGCVTSPTCR